MSLEAAKTEPLPTKLYHLLCHEGAAYPAVIGWSEDGEAFNVHDEEFFVNHIMPKYGFRATKMASLQRNLNIHGFARNHPDQSNPGFYSHMCAPRRPPRRAARALLTRAGFLPPHGRARADPPRSPEGFSSAGAPTFSTRLCAAPSPSTRAVAAAAAAATAAAAARAAAR